MTYGEHAVARAGLLRALSVIRQHWNRATGLDLPGSQEELTVRNGRLTPQVPRNNYVLKMATTAGERTAVVLVQAYEYLRNLFTTRFDLASLLAAESEVEGWIEFYDEDRSAWPVEDYFRNLRAWETQEHVEARFHEAGLSGFYAEAMRMEFDWSKTDIVRVSEHGTKLPYSIVCTSRVLLADCTYDYFEQRRSESLLSAPTLAIERVLATLSLLEILDDDIRRASGRDKENPYSKRADKVRAVVDACSLDQRHVDRRAVLVKPVYEDVQYVDTDSVLREAAAAGCSGGNGRANADGANAELQAVIAMSQKGITFMVGSYSECERAEASGARRVRFPWFLA